MLVGLHSKLGHLTGSPESINISAVLLSAVYPHGGTAGGYDVTDYENISPEFGTMEDFYDLRVAMHKKGTESVASKFYFSFKYYYFMLVSRI